jgi:hypothetical protein
MRLDKIIGSARNFLPLAIHKVVATTLLGGNRHSSLGDFGGDAISHRFEIFIRGNGVLLLSPNAG